MPGQVRRRLIVMAIVFLGPSGLSYGGDADKGAIIFYEHGCYSCHGYNGTGRTPLANSVSSILASENVFIAYLRQRADRNPVLPDNSMPNYSASTLSDAQAKDVYAYIRTLSDDPPAMDDIPAFVKILDAAKAARPDDTGND